MRRELVGVVVVLILAILVQGRGFASNATIRPEQMTYVEMSSTDINRIVCQDTIRDVIYSKEKGITVSIQAKNAFVKFLVQVEGSGKTYTKEPSEIFVACGGEVYSMIAKPKKIPSQTIWLNPGDGKKIKGNVSTSSGIPIERKVVRLVRDVFRGEIPDEYSVKKVRKAIKWLPGVKLTLRKVVKVEGDGLILKEYRVKNVSSGRTIELDEKQFIKKELSERPLGISITKTRIKKGETARAFIVERSWDE